LNTGLAVAGWLDGLMAGRLAVAMAGIGGFEHRAGISRLAGWLAGMMAGWMDCWLA
jgi:hypothetical protein